MIRDLAELTVVGSAFDDFIVSSMLEIIGRQVGVMSNWFVQSPNSCWIRDLAAIIGRQHWFVGSAFDELSMISLFLLCWQ